MTIRTSGHFDRAKIDQTKPYEGHLMVRLGAEDRAIKRTPVSVILVLDTSTSMIGHKLNTLKEVARKVVDNLSSQDEIAIVSFNSVVSTPLKRTPASSKEEALAAISRLYGSGWTNMSSGLLEGFNQVNSKFEGVRRIMLLSDGQANKGVHDRAGLLGIINDRDADCTVSAFGFGKDADNELLADIAKAGGGNHHFVKEDGKELGNVFARELGGILSCTAQNITVTVKPGKDNKVLGILNDYTVDDSEGSAVIHAEDIYVGETKYILVKMMVAKPEAKPKDRAFSVAHVEVSFHDLGEKTWVHKDLNIKVEFVKPEEADKETALIVAERVAVLEAASKQREAVVQARQGNWLDAQTLYRAGGQSLRKSADRGSVTCSGISSGYAASAHVVTEDGFTENSAVMMANTAQGVSKDRSMGTGQLADSLKVKGMVDMEAKFGPGSSAPSPLDAQCGPSTPPLDIPVIAPVETVLVEEAPVFAKKRSRS